MKLKSIVKLAMMAGVMTSFSCNDCCEGKEGKTCDHDKSASTDVVAEEEAHGQESQNNTLSLNNGVKWDANTETTVGVANMVTLSMKGATDTSVEGYQDFGAEYQKELDVIFNKCNMTGAAHDELHNFLFPLIDKVDALKECKTEKEGETVASDIKSYLNLYLEFFK